MEDDLKKNKNGRRPQKKNKNGRRPHKNGRQPKKKNKKKMKTSSKKEEEWRRPKRKWKILTKLDKIWRSKIKVTPPLLSNLNSISTKPNIILQLRRILILLTIWIFKRKMLPNKLIFIKQCWTRLFVVNSCAFLFWINMWSYFW